MNKTFLSVVLLMSGSVALAQATAPAAEIPAQPQEQAQTEWKPSRAWAGDLRIRLRDQKQGASDARTFEALRARLAYKADIEPNLSGVLRFATASSAVSANQNLGDQSAPGMQRRAFGLDLAYLDYRPWAGTQGWIGKTPVPFSSPAKVQLVFDADLDFEGVSAKWAKDLNGWNTFVNLGSSLVSENFAAPNDIPDVALLGAQIGTSAKMFGTWTLDASYYTWDNVQGRSPAQIAGGAISGGRYFGNSTDGTTLSSKFNIVEVGLDWQHTWDRLTSEVYYDWARNSDAALGASSFETGVVLKYDRWTLGYANVFKEADSQLAAFTDSDTNGGGTDTVGNRANLTFQATKNFSVTLTQYNGKRGLSTAAPSDFNETQLDLMGSF
jgi:hypothetical protein